jgi:hypothetical protein
MAQLGSFKAILLGQFSMCTDQATVDAFRKYVRDGGMLIVTNYAFSADANGAEKANPTFELADMWGSSGRSDDQTEESRITAVETPENPLREIVAGLQFPTFGGVARRQMGSARLVAKSSDGTPAITLNRYGKGQVLFIGTNAGEAYNTGHFLEMGTYPPIGGVHLDKQKFGELTRQLEGWQNYAPLLKGALAQAGIYSPIEFSTPDRAALLGKARVSLQEERTSAGDPRYHLLIVTLEPLHNPEAMVWRGAKEFVKPGNRVLKNISLTAKIPHPEKVKAVYRIPPIGYEMGKIEALPERIPFDVKEGKVMLKIPEISEVSCLLVAKDARPLVGVKSDYVGAQEGKPTRVFVTVDNAADQELSGEIIFPKRFAAKPLGGRESRIHGLTPGGRYECEFEVTAPSPIERNRTFHAILSYRLSDGRTGTSSSYPVTSRTDERVAWGWVKRVETAMAEAAQPPTPWGSLYQQALQQRELVYAAYNSGAYADTVRLAREHERLCTRIKEQRKSLPPNPEQ